MVHIFITFLKGIAGVMLLLIVLVLLCHWLLPDTTPIPPAVRGYGTEGPEAEP